MRIICEKYRLRGEANIQNRFSFEGHLTVLETSIFQITLTNRTYLFNCAEYLTASKTVACKQVQNLRPPHSFDFQDFCQSMKTGIFSKKCISGTKSRINRINYGFTLIYNML